MTTVFGKGLRGRRKAAEDDGEVAQIADAANLWWTRRDFVQHAVVLTENPRQPGSPGIEGEPTLSANTPRTGPAPRSPRQRPPTTARKPAGEAPSAPPQTEARAASDPLAGRSFSEVFTTESLFAAPGQGDTSRGPAGARQGAARDETRATGPRPATARPKVAPEPAPEPARPARKGLAANHPLVGALEHLGLARDATWRDIQVAYRAMAKVAHPDRTGDDGEAMALLNAAYTSLRDARSYGLFED